MKVKKIIKTSKSVPRPKLCTDVGMTANGIVLISNPDNDNDVEGGGRVLKELGHDGLHPWKNRHLKSAESGSSTSDSPTNAKMTVTKEAMGKEMTALNSSIWRSSMIKTKI